MGYFIAGAVVTVVAFTLGIFVGAVLVMAGYPQYQKQPNNKKVLNYNPNS